MAVPAGAAGPMLLEGQVDAVLSLQRTAGNRATIRAIGRKPDERTAEIERHADEVTTGVQSQDAAAIEAAFAVLHAPRHQAAARRRRPPAPDRGARTRGQPPPTGRLRRVPPQPDPERASTPPWATPAPGAGDVEQLPENERDVVGEFGPAKPGTSGDDPEGNTYVVYDTHIKTYFMTKVEKSRRSSVWLANNPGNSDELGGMGLGVGHEVGQAHVRDLPHDGRRPKALWEKIQTKDTLKNYLNYHLGQKTDGTFPEGNDPNAYLKHIQAKAGLGAVHDHAEGDRGPRQSSRRCSTAS